jgi:hypothetical protein
VVVEVVAEVSGSEWLVGWGKVLSHTHNMLQRKRGS